ncbi:MAG: Gfo/Idh/MocA family oxidoreductase [Acidimicrobiales bacterium]|jgi:predicted dehydrogenase
MTGTATPPENAGGPGDLYGHTPLEKMFAGADVYGVGYDHHRADRRPLRLGMIGAGGVAQSKWLPALARLRTLWDPVELVGAADPNEDQGRKVARVHGCRWYRDHRQLLSQEKPDAVVIASPDRSHAEHAEDALEAGAAALVEKPFCTSLAEAGRLCDVSAATGATLMPVANLRFSPPFRRAHQFLATLEGFSAERTLLGRMHLGYDYVDVLEGATVHLFDLARFLLGDVAEVRARGLGRVEGAHRYPFRQGVISLDFGPRGAAQLFTSASALSLKPWLRVEVHGQGTWLVVDDVFELVLYDSETGPAKLWKPVLANTLLFDEEFGGYLPQLEHFLQVVRGDEQPSVTPMDGYRAVELITATHLAMASGEAVPLPLDANQADAEMALLRSHW